MHVAHHFTGSVWLKRKSENIWILLIGRKKRPGNAISHAAPSFFSLSSSLSFPSCEHKRQADRLTLLSSFSSLSRLHARTLAHAVRREKMNDGVWCVWCVCVCVLDEREREREDEVGCQKLAA